MLFCKCCLSGKGGKTRRRGTNKNQDTKRVLVLKDEGQEYAQVIKMLGSGRLEAFCFDGKIRQARIRGTLNGRVWISKEDIILISLRDFQDDKCDVIMKYFPEEVDELRKKGHLPAKGSANNDNNGDNDENEQECAFRFENL